MVINDKKNFFGITEFESNLKYPSMGLEMNDFMERSDRGDPTSVRVDMNTAGKIEFSLKPEKTEAIYTFGLCGCVASSLVIELKNGKQIGIITHEDPFSMSVGGLTDLWLKKNLADIKIEDIKKARLFIIAPGVWERKGDGKIEYLIKANYQHSTARFRSQIKSLLENVEEFSETEIPYSEFRAYDKKDQGVFRIIKRLDGKLKYIADMSHISGEVFNENN